MPAFRRLADYLLTDDHQTALRLLDEYLTSTGTGWNANGDVATGGPFTINGDLDVIGSLGLAYEHIDAQPGVTRTLTSADSVFRFKVDIDDLTGVSDVYTLVLPLVSTVDRRIYEFKVTDVLNTSDASAYVDITPNANDYLEDYNQAGNGQGRRKGQGNPLPLQVGDSFTVYADDIDDTWWVV